MKILYAGEPFKNLITGGQRRITEVIEYLSSAEGEVFYLQTKNSPKDFIKRNCFLTNLWYIFWISGMRKREKIIIIEDYSQRFYLFLLNVFISLFFTGKVKLVCLVNAFYFGYRKSAVKNIIDRLISILFLRPADLVIAGGEAAGTELHNLRIPDSRITVIEPALRPEFINYQPEPEQNHNSHTNLLFVGRVNRIKGLEYLIKAVKLLDRRDLRLSIVGDTEEVPAYTKALRKLIEKEKLHDNIIFIGEIKEVDQLIGVYEESDIFVLPSLWDTCPASLLEAMCFGLPIVSTRAGGILQLIDHDSSGILVPPGNSHLLAQAINRLINDHSLRQRLRQKTFERSSKFRDRTWRDVGVEYHQAIEKLLNG